MPWAVTQQPVAKGVKVPVAKVVRVGKSMKKAEIPPLAHAQVAAKPLSKLAVAKVVSNNSVSTPANKTVIEAAAVSLPMASFALDIPGPSVTKPPVPKFPGNATQKAAWEKKEQILEKEVAHLKHRLAKVEATPSKLVAKALPVATGTFNSHVGVKPDAPKDAKLSSTVTESKPAPMEPLRKEKIPKATWPTMQSVAAPVKLHLVHSAVAPPQMEAIEAQQGKAKPAMGSTFTGTPARKAESVMELDTSVVHDAVVTDAAPTDVAPKEVPETSSLWQQSIGWVSSVGSFFTNMFGKKPIAVVPSSTSLTRKAHHSWIQRGLGMEDEV